MVAIALGRADDDRPLVLVPVLMKGLPFKALVGQIRALSGGPYAEQPGVRLMARGEEGLGERLVRGSGRPKAKAGDDSDGIDGHQHRQAFVPPQPVAPTDVCKTEQSQPRPRRFASRVGAGVLSSASKGQCCAWSTSTRERKQATRALACWRTKRLNWARSGRVGKAPRP